MFMGWAEPDSPRYRPENSDVCQQLHEAPSNQPRLIEHLLDTRPQQESDE